MMIFTIIFLFINTSEARKAKPSDYSYMYEMIHRQYLIGEDYKATETVTYRKKILKEEGKKQAVQTIQFLDTIEDVEILEAYTVNNGKKLFVDSDSIIKEKIAGEKSSVDQSYQYKILFPDVGIGSIVHYKIRSIEKQKFLGQYIHHEDLDGYYIKKYIAEIKSFHPIQFEKYNTKGKLRFLTSGQNNYRIESIKPLINDFFEEEYYVYDSGSHLGYLAFTSSDYHDYLRKFTKGFKEVLNQRSPASIKIKENKYDNVYETLSKVQSKLNYISDSRSLLKGIQPKPLEKSWSDGYGDCKDYTAHTVSNLAKQGIKSYPALASVTSTAINPRDFSPLFQVTKLNHVLVKPEGKFPASIIDPTSDFPRIRRLYDDYLDWYAYKLSNDVEAFKITRESNSKIIKKYNISTHSDIGYAEYTLLNGEEEIIYLLKKDKKYLKKYIYNNGIFLLDEDEVINPEIINSKITYTFRINLFKSKDFNGIDYLKIPNMTKSLFETIAPNIDKRVSGIDLGSLLETETIINISGNTEPIKYQKTIKSPWFHIENNVKQTNKTLVLTRKHIPKKRFVHSEDLDAFQKIIKDNQELVTRYIIKI
jgi:hypothetical protein